VDSLLLEYSNATIFENSKSLNTISNNRERGNGYIDPGFRVVVVVLVQLN
jgi:hypothetical protein